MNFINLKYENMTWYDTYEEIKTKYPDTIFEEYWLTKDDADKLRNHESVKKGWATIKKNGNFLSVMSGKNEGDERRILLHIRTLSSFNDDIVIIIKQEGI